MYTASAKYGSHVTSIDGGKSWRAHVRFEGRKLYLGTLSTEDQAGEVLSWYALCPYVR